LTYANKCTYRGEFKKGLIHGYGEMTFPNGDSYIGNWNAGLRHGNGACAVRVSCRVVSCGLTPQTQHAGTYKRANGDYYVGDYVKGERHGKGELMEDGDRYEGDFANGHPHGRGTYVYHTGARYEGDLRDGEPDGHGTFGSADGSVYTGDFVVRSTLTRVSCRVVSCCLTPHTHNTHGPRRAGSDTGVGSTRGRTERRTRASSCGT